MENTTMQLSEAIRMGASMKPQVFGTLRRVIERRPIYKQMEIPTGEMDCSVISVNLETEVIYGTCAWGAALDAIGMLDQCHQGILDQNYLAASATVPQHWLDTLKHIRNKKCPMCSIPIPELTIIHLNDHHKWSRERIADLVESVEKEIMYLPNPSQAVSSNYSEEIVLT